MNNAQGVTEQNNKLVRRNGWNGFTPSPEGNPEASLWGPKRSHGHGARCSESLEEGGGGHLVLGQHSSNLLAG